MRLPKLESHEDLFYRYFTICTNQGIALLRLDADMYETTKQSLEILYPKLSKAGFVIIDDYHDHPKQCGKALDEYGKKHSI